MTTRLLIIVVLAACGGARPYTHADVMWRDPDMVPFSPKPASYSSPEVWNTIDNTVFRPLVDALAVRTTRRAPNVNALDEVPDSSWFTNRIEVLARDPHAFARGPCTQDPPDPAGPWTVIGGKPNGVNPGFMLRHASGRKYLFKLDGGPQGERASAADVIGSRLYYAAGYNAPCNDVIYIDPKTIVVAPNAKVEDFVGDKIPFTQRMLDDTLVRSLHRGDGTVRGGLSLMLEGVLGPWKDFGTRGDDPNDVIAHEDRRDLRGSYVIGAWLAHYDAREQNSLDTWVQGGDGAGFIRHYMLDFGDCFGSMSSWSRVSNRRGLAYELDWPLGLVELVTFGAIDRSWRHARTPSATFGFYDVDHFVADHFRTAYPFGPYARATESDAAWAARILARMSPALIHVAIEEAHLSDPQIAAELETILLGRRDKLLRRYLGEMSPLAAPRVEQDRLCVTDLRRVSGLESGDPELCVAIEAREGDQSVEIAAPGAAAIRVHVFHDGSAYRITGVDRARR